MYLALLGVLQDSRLGEIARSAGWAYAGINTLHVLGAALVLGAIGVFDVLVLARRGPDAVAAARAAIPLATLGLAVQLATGVFLLAADARTTGTNPAFAAKLAFIALGLANVAALHLRFGAPWRGGFEAASARIFALVSLFAWTGTVAAGRMIAYV